LENNKKKQVNPLKNVDKAKSIVCITIGIICFILVFTMSVQFNTIEQTDLASITTMREAELREELTKWNTRYEELNQKYQEDKVKKEEYQASIGTDVEASGLIDQELKETNILLGLTDVTGSGIEIVLSDNSEKDIDAYDLLELINELRLAGAEAISINGERIIAMSEIVDINYSFIVINGNRISSPYIVKAIGNQTYLESGLTAKEYGYMDNIIKGNGKTATLERKDIITIPKFTGKLEMKYAE